MAQTEQSLTLLSERIAAVDTAVRQTVSAWRPPASLTAGPWSCTGAGGSEGPARVLASCLRSVQQRADFLPLSTFAVDFGERGHLVVFSQGLSPNARLALARREPFETTTLVTATGTHDPLLDELGSSVLRHAPEQESGLLVRVMGPAGATATALLLVAELAGRAEAEARAIHETVDRLDEARSRARAAFVGIGKASPIALVTAGRYRELVHGLRWKLLESLGVADPPVWDVLQVAHGPFQQFYESPMLLCALELPDEAALFDRLERMLVPERHRLIRLRATRAAPTAWFEHDAMLNELVLAVLRDHPRDLIDWPGKGKDAALYRLGPDSR
ncbi:MAG TPA: hypothetical protein VFB62_11595 [Polyangiaceae bacterium]|jgi:creatinine amidohydrolase|nr:hypothetical protein [Polyangiaceae bacterium]